MDLYNIENNSVANLEHLIQMVKHFFPYAQKQLGFHKPVMISFQSDEENANKLLGKTGYYNPNDFSIAIFVDGRHPKDILRSLSHELVHHSQNCNGDFDSGGNLGPGYAQENPAMRNAELDAYKRGNIIFRDFEDLIKKGKIKVNINFEDTGEPKMSLKEWKNNELNMLLMKKWKLLKEDSGAEEHRHAEDNIRDDEKHIKNLKRDEKDDEKELEEGTPAYRDEDEDDLDESHVDFARSRGQLHKTIPPQDDDDKDARLARAYGAGAPEGMSDEEAAMAGYTIGRGGSRGLPVPPEVLAMKKKGPATPEYAGKKVKARAGSRSPALVRGAPRENQEISRKISPRETIGTLTLDEARDLARRIFEKLTKETK